MSQRPRRQKRVATALVLGVVALLVALVWAGWRQISPLLRVGERIGSN